jgi:PEP-CTERM motif-containing protein
MRSLRATLALLALAPAVAAAQPDVTPDLGAVTTGSQAPGVWYVDRYAPAGFASVGAYQGRSDALRISVAPGTRTAPYTDAFYNTQGRKYDLSTVGPFTLTADLFVPETWGDATLGLRRTDLWGTLVDATDAPTAYPIIGFTNYDGSARFRSWNGGGWDDLASGVQFGAWNTLGFSFDGSVFSYFVNGAAAGTTIDASGSAELADVMLQAYDFGQSFGPNASPAYDAHWSNTPVTATPEPASLALVAGGLLAIGAVIRKRRR